MKRAVLLGCFVSLFVISAVAQNSAAHPELLVSTQWLAGHLHDPDLVLVQIGRKDDDYKKQHIPGARWLPVANIATVQDHPGTELLAPEVLKQNLEQIGVGDHSRVVIYTTDYDPIAARLFYTLDYLGAGTRAALLDGSMERWTREQRPTTADTPAIKPGHLTIALHPEVNAKMASIKDAIAAGRAPLALVDARPMTRYTAGHLPGAMPMFWQTTQQDHLLKSPAELRQMFAAAGVAPGKRMVSYCEVGQQASYVYFVARYLGLDAAMYDGSYMEWSSANQPVVKGDAPQ